MNILGITAPLSWNTAACLLQNGHITAMAEEERFVRIKHAPRIPPYQATKFCLKKGSISFNEIDAVAIGYKAPLPAFVISAIENIKNADLPRMIREAGAFAEYYIGLVRYTDWLKNNGVDFTKTNLYFISHHLAHAASAYYCSGFNQALIVTMDGQGEGDAGFIGLGKQGTIKKIASLSHHQSLGWFFSEVTDLLGFKPHSDEGKVMGLAAFGKRINLPPSVQKTEAGFFFKSGWPKQLRQQWGPSRLPVENILTRHKNIAYSAQEFVNTTAARLVTFHQKKNGQNNVVLAGGVTLNCDMNQEIRERTGANIFIQPAAHDAGTALGAAIMLSCRLQEPQNYELTHPYWGETYTNDEIENCLKIAKVSYKKVADITTETAKYLAKGKIIGWFQGRFEWGPRALGNRSILAHPGLTGMKDRLNKQVKQREPWRPFAPSILHEYGTELVADYIENPYMTMTFHCNTRMKKHFSQAIHIDGTARIQSVSDTNNPGFASLIRSFMKETGIPGLLNTSFNTAGEPMVASPTDAIRTFFSSGLDMLVLGNMIITK